MNDEVIRIEPDVRLAVYVSIDDLEYDNEIKRIKEMDISFEEKLELAKKVAIDIAVDKLMEVNANYLQGSDVEIKDFDNFEITFERIDWEKLLSKE